MTASRDERCYTSNPAVLDLPKPVELETCKTDHEGDAVHEACHVARLSYPKPPSKHF